MSPRPDSTARVLLASPLWNASALLYVLNRFAGKPLAGHALPFLRSHLDDLLFFPVAYPVLLLILERLALRPPTTPVHPAHCLLWLAVWSLLFEIAFPALLHRGVADPLDAACYAVGTAIFLALHGPRLPLPRRG
jgi:hypothetical protein